MRWHVLLREQTQHVGKKDVPLQILTRAFATGTCNSV